MSVKKTISCALFLCVGAASAEGRATEDEARHHLEIGPSLAVMIVEHGDGPNLNAPSAYGAHVGYRYRPLPWLELGGSAMFRASEEASYWFFPAVVGFRLPLRGGHGLFANVGGGYLRYDGKVRDAWNPTPWTLQGAFALVGLGGTAQVASAWSVTAEVGAIEGFGTLRSDYDYIGVKDALAVSAYLNLGARYSF